MTQTNEKSNVYNSAMSPFKAPIGLRNAHFQTIFSSVGPRRWNRQRRFEPYIESQESIVLDGGDGIRLEGVYNRALKSGDTSKELVILIHGWEGSHESTYMISMAATLLKEGFDTFRLNLRDHGDTHHLNEGVFNSTMIDEVVHAIENLQMRFNYAGYSLVGFSLGGNFSLRVAAKSADKAICLDRVIAFCPVIHAKQSNTALHQPRNALYGRYFVRKWKRSLIKKAECWPQYPFFEQLSPLKTLDEMNDVLIPGYTGFNKIDDYFNAYTLAGPTLAHTVCPCYVHFAKDDMIIPIDGIGLLANNQNLHITSSEHGGHCGFIMNWRGDSWQDTRVLEIIKNTNV